jgi:hypothetical protein
MFGPGDYFQGQFIYSEGATGYLAQTARGTVSNYWSGGSVGYGFWDDAVYTRPTSFTGGSIEKTTGWSAFASYEHFWTPSLRTSIYGTMVDLRWNATATTAICNTQASTATTVAGFQGATCSPNWSSWAVGTRSQWNVTKDFYVGLDVIYLKLNTASPNAANLLTIPVTATVGAKTPGVYTVDDQDTWAATFRVHRDVVP